MTWCNDSQADVRAIQTIPNSTHDENHQILDAKVQRIRTLTCPSCGHSFELHDPAGIQDLPGLPAGVKFDPSDPEILEHLEAKVSSNTHKLHPLIDEFIPTLQGENGICSTHPERLPGVSKDGQIRHFFHRPSKAYTTGTRKRRKVHTDPDGGETRWHKTGKTRPVYVNGTLTGFKKILVLYTNYGRQRKPEKTNWVMHQYHLGNNEEERDGELVVSKVFYQTQPRQCAGSNNSSIKDTVLNKSKIPMIKNAANFLHEYYINPPLPPQFVSYHDIGSQSRESPAQVMPSLVVQGDGSSFIHPSSLQFNQGEA